MTMEKIALPGLDFVKKQFEKIDEYGWYCNILKEHAKEGFAMYGMPAPVYVGMRMARMQTQDNFGMAEMKDFLVPLCNAMYVLNKRTTHVSLLKEFKPKFSVTFDKELMTELSKQMEQVEHLINAHSRSMNDMREGQKESWKIEKKMTECCKTLNVFFDDNNCDDGSVPNKLRKKYNMLKKKQNRAVNSYEDKIILLTKKLNNEEEIRREIKEIVANIKDILKKNMKKGITNAYNNLVEAINIAKAQEGYEMRKQLEKVCVERIVDELYSLTCTTYKTPVPEGFMVDTNFEVILPPVKRQQCEYKSKGMHNNTYFKRWRNIKIQFSDLAGKIEPPDGCFFPNSGGCSITRKQLLGKYSQGFLNIKSGHEIKLKLLLMGGSVGFGWRRNTFSAKKWGFYPLNKKNCVVQALNKSFTPPSAMPSTVQEGRVCLDKIPGFKELSKQEKITKITKDFGFSPIKDIAIKPSVSDEDVYSSNEELFI